MNPLTPEQKIELFQIVKGIGPETRLEAHEDLRDAFKQKGWELPEYDIRSKLVTEYLASTKKKLHHSKNPALTLAVPVTQEYPRRDLKGLYPGFTIERKG